MEVLYFDCGFGVDEVSMPLALYEISGSEHPQYIDNLIFELKNPQDNDNISIINMYIKVSALTVPDEVKEDMKHIFHIIFSLDKKYCMMSKSFLLLAISCSLIRFIKAEKIIVSPINIGNNPPSLVLNILGQVPVYSNNTPTLCDAVSIAVLKYYQVEFAEMPVIMCEKTACTESGFKVFYGSRKEDSKVLSIECNIDDMTGERLGYCTEKLMENGALDVFATPIYMKKNRPAYMLTCICRVSDKDKFTRMIFKNTTTRGMRYRTMERSVMKSELLMVDTEYGEVVIKKSFGYDLEKYKPEYESVKKAAEKNNVSFETVYNAAMKKL